MLTRSLDEILRATQVLPDHLVIARRYYDRDQRTLRAFRALQDALMAVDTALLGRDALPPRAEATD